MKSIASKLVNIMKACEYVQKDKENTYHGYKYVSAANVLEKVNSACVEQNVASVVSSKIASEKEKVNEKGKTEFLVTVELTLTLVDGDTGETLTITSLGTGQDIGDKAVAKAQTMALKYAWMTSLNISTGDDPEADEGADKRNHASSNNDKGKTTTGDKKTTASGNKTTSITDYICKKCGKKITKKVYDYNNLGLCMDCQKEAKNQPITDDGIPF